MSELQFLADMNISPQTVSDLCRQGWDVVRVSDLIPDNSPDEDILRMSITNSDVITRVLLEVLPNIEHILREGFAVTIDDRGARARKLPIE